MYPAVMETVRFVLRRTSAEDAEGIFSGWATDAEVVRYLGWRAHRDIGETRAFLARCERQWEEGVGFPMIILRRGDDRLPLGMVHPERRGDVVSVGFVLRREVWGQGCATEVLRAVAGRALAEGGVVRVEAFCDVENRASARVMEKAGFVREGVRHAFFVHPNISGKPRDCVMFVLERAVT